MDGCPEGKLPDPPLESAAKAVLPDSSPNAKFPFSALVAKITHLAVFPLAASLDHVCRQSPQKSPVPPFQAWGPVPSLSSLKLGM